MNDIKITIINPQDSNEIKNVTIKSPIVIPCSYS